MPRALRRLVPSMFNRRLLLLATAALAATCLLAAKLAWLTLVEGAVRKDSAERVLKRTSHPRTARGRILDCKGRILAADVPSDDLAVHYSVITGEWARRPIHILDLACKSAEKNATQKAKYR